MATLSTVKTRLRKAISEQFPGADLKIVNGGLPGKLGGTLVWDGFVTKDQFQRQRMLRKALDNLDEDDRDHLGGIVTLTSYEVAAIKESSRER